MTAPQVGEWNTLLAALEDRLTASKLIGNPCAFAHRAGSGNVALPAGTWTKINLGQIASSINIGGWGISGLSLVVPKTGIYSVTASLLFATPTAICTIIAGIGLNGVLAPMAEERTYNGVANNVNWTINCTRLMSLTEGDTLQLLAWCSAAGGAVLDTNSGTFITAHLVGQP